MDLSGNISLGSSGVLGFKSTLKAQAPWWPFADPCGGPWPGGDFVANLIAVSQWKQNFKHQVVRNPALFSCYYNYAFWTAHKHIHLPQYEVLKHTFCLGLFNFKFPIACLSRIFSIFIHLDPLTCKACKTTSLLTSNKRATEATECLTRGSRSSCAARLPISSLGRIWHAIDVGSPKVEVLCYYTIQYNMNMSMNIEITFRFSTIWFRAWSSMMMHMQKCISFRKATNKRVQIETERCTQA